MIEERDILEQELGFTLNSQEPQGPESLQVASAGKVAGLMSQLWKGKKTKTQDIVETYREKKGKTKAPTKEQIDTILGDTEASGEGTPPPDAPAPAGKKGPLQLTPEDVVGAVQEEYKKTEVPTDKRTKERNINVERHHEGARANPDLANMDPDVALENMETADDIARLLDASAKVQGLAEGPRTHASIAERTNTFAKAKEELRTVFEADPDAIGALTDVQLHAGRRMLSTLGEQTIALANAIDRGDKTPETLLNYQKKTEAFIALHSFMQGKVKEAARALSQQRMIAKTLDGHDVEQIADFIELGTSYRTPEDVARHASNTSKKAKEMGTDRAMVDSTKPQARDYWKAGVEYWVNNILSGTETFVINLTSSPLVAAYEGVIVNNLAAGIGAARQQFGIGATERVQGQEQVARMVGGAIGLRDGLTAMLKTLKTAQTQFGPEKGEELRGALHKVFGYWGEQAGENIPGITKGQGEQAGKLVGDAMTLSFRGLSAGDALWKTNIFRSEFSAHLAREAYDKGVDDVGDYVNKGLENPQNHDEAYNAAMDLARRYTFTDTDRPGLLGDVARGTKKIVADYPYMKFLITFVDTPMNLVHYAAENSALAPFSQRWREDMMAGGAKADIAVARWMAGIGMTLVAYDLASDESYINTLTGARLVGEGPENFQARELLKMTGSGENVMYFAGDYYHVNRLDPFAMTIFSIVNSVEDAKYAKSEWGFAEGVLRTSLNIAEHATSATYAKGINDFLNTMQGRKDPDKLMASYASGFVPYSGFQKSLKKLIDPQPRKMLDDKKFETTAYDIITQKIQQGSPWSSTGLGPTRYWDGSVVHPRNGKPVHKMGILDKLEEVLSPVKVTSPRKRDAATEALIENGLGPAMPSPVVTYGGVSFSMLSLDDEAGIFYDAYAVEAGKYMREAVEEIISDDAFKDLDAGYDSEQRAQLSSALVRGRRAGLDKFMTEDLKSFIDKYPDAASELARRMGDVSLETLIEQAREERLEPTLQEKFKVKGISERGGLPLPPHIEEQVLESIPEF